MKKEKKFPIYDSSYIFNKFNGKINKNYKRIMDYIELLYPVRLDAMAINPSAVCYNDDMIFTPGEVVVSINKFIKVTIKVIDSNCKIKVSDSTKRKVLVKHAYYLMKDVLNFRESLYIDVDDSEILKHCGFGSSSSTIAAVASAINEMFSKPIKNEDLIKYLASNHGEEIDDFDDNNLKMVQCIGGGATSGLTNAGIMIIAGKSTTICKMNYEGNILIGIPKDFVEQNAEYLMTKEEENLWKFKRTGDLYSKEIAYNFLHIVLPDMINNKIDSLADLVFDYRFNMGSIENCSFVYLKMIEQGNKIRKLYEDKKCDFLALSSVGPAYFLIVNNKENENYCEKYLKKIGFNIHKTSICNDYYKITNYKYINEIDFWNQTETAKQFHNMKPSKYITNEIDSLNNIQKAIDIGCGGGRYSLYLTQQNIKTIAIDKYETMANEIIKKGIDFTQASFDNLPSENEEFDLALSIGVYHNALSKEELMRAISEAYRVLKPNGKFIVSIFTNDIITDDLTQIDEFRYFIKERPPMILMSKNQIDDLFIKQGFKKIKNIDEHITDVGAGGKRNVYSVLFEK